MKLPFRQVHLDCHTPALPFIFGYNFDKKSFKKTLLNAHINSITLTGRCHHGHIYYDTGLEARHPNLENDFLMEMVDACHEIDVRCPIYLSVGWDAFMANKHADWISIDKNGSYYGFEDHNQLQAGWKKLCFNSPYMAYLTIQIKDTMQHFAGKLDGLFFDILWQDPCYCNQCLKKMEKEGVNPLHEEEVRKFARVTEIRTKQKIADVVKSMDPNCAIFFNEGNITPLIRDNLANYSHIEIESLPSSSWGYQHFPVAIRYAKTLGKEYVGMTARFHRGWADFGSYKNLRALEYECFLSLAHGGKCSIGDQLYADGTLNQYTYQRIGKVYQEIEKREEYAQAIESVATIAIIHPGIIEQGMDKVDNSLGGAANMLNELHYQFDIIDDHTSFDKYQLLLLPDKIYLSESLEKKLYTYCQNGGKLFLSYHSGLMENKQYPSWMGLKLIQECEYHPSYIFNNDIFDTELVVHGNCTYVESKGETIANIGLPMYQRAYNHYYGHYHAPIDKITKYPAFSLSNNIIYSAHNIFEVYRQEEVSMLKEVVGYVVKKMLGEPEIIMNNLPESADVIVNHQSHNNRFILNILYYVPVRKGLQLDTIEDKVPLYNIDVKVSKKLLKKYTNKAITKVYAPISNITMNIKDDDQYVSFTIKEVNGYEIITLQYD